MMLGIGSNSVELVDQHVVFDFREIVIGFTTANIYSRLRFLVFSSLPLSKYPVSVSSSPTSEAPGVYNEKYQGDKGSCRDSRPDRSNHITPLILQDGVPYSGSFGLKMQLRVMHVVESPVTSMASYNVCSDTSINILDVWRQEYLILHF
jgi:hypothetical protein